jgi:hypothetical protein
MLNECEEETKRMSQDNRATTCMHPVHHHHHLPPKYIYTRADRTRKIYHPFFPPPAWELETA